MKILSNYAITVAGSAKTKDQAIASALGNIQKQVMSQQNGMIIRIEPEDVECIEAIEKIRKERFLLFFFPRSISEFHVKLKVTVNLIIFETEKIEFQKVEDMNGWIRTTLKGSQPVK